MRITNQIRPVQKAERFTPATNGKGNYRGSQWYVLDRLTTGPLETNDSKGWYNTKKICQSVCDRLNAKETAAGRWYEETDNGFVKAA